MLHETMLRDEIANISTLKNVLESLLRVYMLGDKFILVSSVSQSKFIVEVNKFNVDIRTGFGMFKLVSIDDPSRVFDYRGSSYFNTEYRINEVLLSSNSIKHLKDVIDV